MCEPSGPIENGTTYMVRPRIEPLNRPGVPSALPVCSKRAHLGWIDPVVGRAGIFLARRADEGAVLDAGHVARVAAGQEAVRPLGRVQPLEHAAGHQAGAQAVVLFLRTVAPVHVGSLGQRGDFGHPGDEPSVFDMGGHVEPLAIHRGVIHLNSNRRSMVCGTPRLPRRPSRPAPFARGIDCRHNGSCGSPLRRRGLRKVNRTAQITFDRHVR